MPKRSASLDQVFQALADPTRRKVIERLVAGPATTSELAEPFDMALPSFTQHLGVLERAGLVTSSKQGRVRIYQLDPAGLAVADGWLADKRRLWERRLDQLDELLMTLKEDQRASPPTPWIRPATSSWCARWTCPRRSCSRRGRPPSC
jgi:DNA-binding transcriptional ArsR family regulator